MGALGGQGSPTCNMVNGSSINSLYGGSFHQKYIVVESLSIGSMSWFPTSGVHCYYRLQRRCKEAPAN